ncbi:MAG: shikimate kinase [Oscillospiraceae bacterium]|jgi:shikimate dehydrogenase|nr:shikimate kinase [Oscillospiraceae bacterium]
MQYALIGEHLGHSYSPEIHKMIGGYDYALAPMPPEALPEFFARRDFQGINVTIPYKKAVMPFCDTLGETAKRVGSVNTILKRADGSLFGDNTDPAGFCFMLQSANISMESRHVLVLGGGGASLTVQLAASEARAASVSVAELGGALNYENIYEACAQAQVIINATPVGMFPKTDAKLVDLERFPRCEAVADLIYNPLRTKLLQQAKALGLRHVNGLGMLVAQAAAAAEIFTGIRQGAEKIDEIYRKLYNKTENWVIIGMPGAGKSTVGTELARRSGRKFIDVDWEIERRAGLSCGEIITQRGEEQFRALECEVVRELGARTGLVIATGGGTVLKDENVFALRQNGKLLWIRRGADRLATFERPLSKNLREMEQTRRPFYEKAADATILHDENWERLQLRAWEVFHA